MTAATPPILHEEDLAYAKRLAAGDPQALLQFEARHMALVPSYLTRFRFDAAAVDELRQQLRCLLLVEPTAKIHEYRGAGPFDAWLRAITVRLGLQHLRKMKPAPTPDEALLASGATPELLVLKDQIGEAVNAALAAAFDALETEDRNILRWYFFDGVGVVALGELLGVHASNAARRLQRLQTALYEAVRKHLPRSSLRDSELDSLVRLVFSRMNAAL